MKKMLFFVMIFALSAMMTSCYTLGRAYDMAYTLSGAANNFEYTKGYYPIQVGEQEYVTPGKSTQKEYGVSIEWAEKELQREGLRPTKYRGTYRDSRGCIGHIFVACNITTGLIGEYTVTKYGVLKRK